MDVPADRVGEAKDGGGCCVPPLPVPLTPGRAHELCAVLGALADPIRLRLLSLIAAADGAVCVCDLRAAFALSPPTISHHLKVLREAGLVTWTRDGTRRHYRTCPGALRALTAALAEPGLIMPASPNSIGR